MSDSGESSLPAVRPRDFAVLLLSSGDVTPRQRARDQQADRAGLALKHRVLSALLAADPEPEDLEASLATIIEELGHPTGPTRAIALALLDEWRILSATPEWLAQLLGDAVRGAESQGGRHGKQLPS